MTRRHIVWLIEIFVIGLVLATRNAPLRHAAPPGFTLLPSTLPGQQRRALGYMDGLCGEPGQGGPNRH